MDEPDDLPIIELDTEDAADAPGPPRPPTGTPRRRLVAVVAAVVVAAGAVIAVASRDRHHGRARTEATIVLPPPASTTTPPIRTLDPDAEFVSAFGIVPPLGAWAIDNLELATTTADAHWRNITPPGFLDPVDRTTALAFLDAGHAWVATDVPAPTIWRTSDGGHSWQASRLNLCGAGCGHVVSLDFLDARRGWVAYVNGGSGALAVTDDGGATWRGLAPAPVLGPLQFADARHGWLTSSDQVGAIFRTSDGGTTWSFVAPADAHAAAVAAPSFFGADTVVVAAAAVLQTPDRITISRSTDGGGSWTSFPSPLGERNPLHDPSEDRFTATSASDWALLDGQHLYVTRDSGAHWATLTPTHTRLRSVAFANRSEGWLLADVPGCGGPITGCNDQYLYRTADGGRTWTLRSPTAGVTANRSP